MNRKGQTLILFIFLIPILLLLMAIIVDIGFLTHAKIKLSGVTEYAIQNYVQKEEAESKIKELFIKNNIPIENLKIIQTDQILEIKNEYQINSIFGKIIGIQNYRITIHKKGNNKTEKLIIENERKEDSL